MTTDNTLARRLKTMMEGSSLAHAGALGRPASTASARKISSSKLHTLIGIVLSFCLIFALTPASAFAAKQTICSNGNDTTLPVVRIGWHEGTYHISGDDGERSGYGYEYEQTVASYTGWQYEYVKGGWVELFNKLERGEIDMMAALAYTDERAKHLLFSERPVGTEKYHLYANLKDSSISAENPTSINGKRIGIMKDSFEDEQLSTWEANLGIKTRHVYFSSVKEAKELAEKGKIDGIVSMKSPRWADLGFSALTTIGGSDVYFGISKDRPDLKAQLDKAMAAISSDKPFYTDELCQKYLSAQFVAVASKKEKTWLAKHGGIRVGFLDFDLGISTLNTKTGELSGVINDYVIAAASCLENQRLDFRLISYHTADELLQALGSGEIDMIFRVSQNPYYAELNNLTLSNTVLTLPAVALSVSHTFDENAKNRVAICKNHDGLRWYVSYNYPQWEIVECDTMEDAERAVQNREADCLLVDKTGEAMRYYDNSDFHGVFLNKPGNVCFAVCKGNTTLLSLLNKTLTTMSTSELSNAVTVYEESARKVTLMDFVKDNLVVAASTMIISFLIVLTAILALLARTRRSELKATVAMQQAESANAAKSDFLFNLSHDIRTPMSAILGFSELAEKHIDDPKQVENYLEKVQTSSHSMLSILDNVLELSRIESRKVVLEETPQEVNTILDTCMVMMAPDAQRKNHTVTVDKEITHPYVYLDAPRVTEIAVNLLSNSIKYTADGGEIHCTLRQHSHPRDGWIYQELSIADNGIGMSEEFQRQIYEPFAREKSSTLSGVQGTGLGMGIVKNLVNLMSGTIDIDSKLGVGTTVTVTIPVRLATLEDMKPKASNADVSADKLRGVRVLLAEDNDLNAEIAMTLLEEEGMIVDRVCDGVECVDKLESSPADYYAVILMDIQMPNMNGFMATKKIRQLDDKTKANIPIIAMTANAFSEDRAKSLAADMNEHLSKPIDMNALVALLLKYV